MDSEKTTINIIVGNNSHVVFQQTPEPKGWGCIGSLAKAALPFLFGSRKSNLTTVEKNEAPSDSTEMKLPASSSNCHFDSTLRSVD